jgi:hypothetical protein
MASWAKLIQPNKTSKTHVTHVKRGFSSGLLSYDSMTYVRGSDCHVELVPGGDRLYCFWPTKLRTRRFSR